MIIPDYLHGHVSQLLATDQMCSERKSLWAVILGLVPFRDGNTWSVLLGKNMMEGVVAFGDSPEKAFWEFEKGKSVV